jgi:hypothetical protein
MVPFVSAKPDCGEFCGIKSHGITVSSWPDCALRSCPPTLFGPSQIKYSLAYSNTLLLRSQYLSYEMEEQTSCTGFQFELFPLAQ